MKRGLVIRLGWAHNRWVILLRGYNRGNVIDDILIKAIVDQTKAKHGTAIDQFDYIKILGWVDLE